MKEKAQNEELLQEVVDAAELSDEELQEVTGGVSYWKGQACDD